MLVCKSFFFRNGAATAAPFFMCDGQLNFLVKLLILGQNAFFFVLFVVSSVKVGSLPPPFVSLRKIVDGKKFILN